MKCPYCEKKFDPFDPSVEFYRGVHKKRLVTCPHCKNQIKL